MGTMIRPFQRHSRLIMDSDLSKQSSGSSFFGKKNKQIPGTSHTAENALKLHFKRTSTFASQKSTNDDNSPSSGLFKRNNTTPVGSTSLSHKSSLKKGHTTDGTSPSLK